MQEAQQTSEQSSPPPSAPPTSQQSTQSDAGNRSVSGLETTPETVSDGDGTQDWRAILAGDDHKAIELLSRSKTPADFLKSHQEMRRKLSERPASVQLAADATPEQIAEYRASLGIEAVEQDAKPEAFLKAYGIETPDGHELSDIDNGLLTDFAKQAYEGGHDPRTVQQAVGWYFEQQEAVRQASNEDIVAKRQEWQGALRQELGRDYDMTINVASTYFHKSIGDEAVAGELLNARLEGGGLLQDHPGFVRFLADAALNSGFGDKIEANAMESGGKPLAQQHNELEALLDSDPAKYNLPETQERLNKIIELRAKRGEIDQFGNEQKRR